MANWQRDEVENIIYILSSFQKYITGHANPESYVSMEIYLTVIIKYLILD